MKSDKVLVIGGGLAGCEAAYRLASMGVPVQLAEMRPLKKTAAHKTGYLGELVCSNSLKSEDVATAQGVLKQEMRHLNSLILMAADKCRVPAGSALAVDREMMGQLVTEIITNHPLIDVVIKEIQTLPDFSAFYRILESMNWLAKPVISSIGRLIWCLH
jgi:methylenetetrahydrofolate--tRNA-(uracil-5-)-methyltransferase